MRILILNGATRGSVGNTQRLLEAARAFFPADVETAVIDLATYSESVASLFQALDDADGFLVGTGVYWSSWGTPLQRFIEVATAREATSTFLGKPVGCVVSMDAIGGADVAARVVSTFSLFGCVVPPFAIAIVSRVGVALGRRDGFEDVWQPEDLSVVVDNLVAAARMRHLVTYASWAVTPLLELKGPYPAPGAIDFQSAPFLDDNGVVDGVDDGCADGVTDGRTEGAD